MNKAFNMSYSKEYKKFNTAISMNLPVFRISPFVPDETVFGTIMGAIAGAFVDKDCDSVETCGLGSGIQPKGGRTGLKELSE